VIVRDKEAFKAEKESYGFHTTVQSGDDGSYRDVAA
jgi:hypothetical protein